MNWLFEKWYVGRSRNYCQIQISILACVMSREYFTRTSLYLVRLKISEWTTLLWRHLHQILVKQASRNLITALRVNSRLITHAGMNESEIYNYTCTNRFNLWIINSFMEYWGVCLTWLDCKPSGSKSTLYEVAVAIFINKLKGNISAVFFFYPYSVRNPFENLSDPVSFGLPVNTVNFYITGSAGRLGAW